MKNKKTTVTCEAKGCTNSFTQKTRRNVYCCVECRTKETTRRIRENAEANKEVRAKEKAKVPKKFLVRGTIHNLSRGSALGC